MSFSNNHHSSVEPRERRGSSSTIISNHRSNSIKHCLEVIQNKMADLQEQGVPCGMCYISQRSLYTMGHPSITQTIERSRDVILTQLSESSSSNKRKRSSLDNDILSLPPLSNFIEKLSTTELRTLITSLIKELGYKWSDDKPSFWPHSVPFKYPQNISEDCCNVDSLREVVKSLYTHYNSTKTTTDKLPLVGGAREEESEAREEVGEVEDEEEEEVDVGTPEDVHPVGVVNILSTDDISDNEEGAESDRPPLSYFGYELARSESSHASSPLPNHTHTDQEEASHDVSSYKRGLSLLQPHLIYCPHGIYSQIYPSISLPTTTATPLLLPLMKQVYVPPTCEESPPTLSPRINEDTNEKGMAQCHSVTPPPPIGPEQPVKVTEIKNKKSKNGIYIYTTPTAPLQFMSLNNKSSNHTHSSHAHSNHTHILATKRQKCIFNDNNTCNSRKLIATAPVSPHTGEPLREKNHAPLKTTPTINEVEKEATPPPPRHKVGGATMKKKRELVFHWYKSPDAPPTTKRPKLLDTNAI